MLDFIFFNRTGNFFERHFVTDNMGSNGFTMACFAGPAIRKSTSDFTDSKADLV